MSAQPSAATVPTILDLQKRLVADAVMLLQRASVVRGGITANERICAVLGISELDLADAAHRVATRRPGPLLGHRPLALVPPIDDKPVRHRRPIVAFDSQGRPKNPTPGTRRCCHCDEVKPLSDFRVAGRTKAGGPKYKAFCLPCEAAYQKTRYLSVKMLDQLGKVGVAFIADQTMVCSICDQPIDPGSEVMVHGEARHADHSEPSE